MTCLCKYVEGFSNAWRSQKERPSQKPLQIRCIKDGMMQGLHSVLSHCESDTQLKAMDVMLACVQHDPQLLREHLLVETSAPDMPNGGSHHTSLFDILIG